MAKSPPAIVGDFIGFTKSSSFSKVPSGKFSHLKCNPQLNPPLTRGLGVYAKVSAFIISMMGVTTLCLFSLTLARSGSSQFTLTSIWLSRKTRT